MPILIPSSRVVIITIMHDSFETIKWEWYPDWENDERDEGTQFYQLESVAGETDKFMQSTPT